MKFLGIFLDSNLKWKTHVHNLCVKLRRIAYLIGRLRAFLDIGHLTQIYHAFFHSILTYGIIAWGGAYDSTFRGIQSLQNKVLGRIGLGSSEGIHNILGVRKSFLSVSAMHAFKEARGQSRPVEGIRTTKRTKNEFLAVPRRTTSLGQRSFSYVGPKIFNAIPYELRRAGTFDTIRRKCRVWIKTQKIDCGRLIGAAWD